MSITEEQPWIADKGLTEPEDHSEKDAG